MSRTSHNGSTPQPREGPGSRHPSRFARRRRPPRNAPAPALGPDGPLAGLSKPVLLRRAAAAGVETEDRPLGEIARDVALAEAAAAAGVSDAAVTAAAGDGPATSRAAAAAAAGVRPDAAILAALRRPQRA